MKKNLNNLIGKKIIEYIFFNIDNKNESRTIATASATYTASAIATATRYSK
jgi:hypothetical protein